MEETPYLLFSLHQLRHAVDARVVQEVLWLPELTPVAEAPPDVVGVFNLRGRIVPVMDYDLRLGRVPQRYRPTDSVIILDLDGLLMGMIVHEVHHVRSIPLETIERVPSYGWEGEPQARFISGAAKVDDEIIMLLNPDHLVRSSTSEAGSADNEVRTEARPAAAADQRAFCPEASPEERTIFRERAQQLIDAADSQDFTRLIPLAVIGLSGEYFGVELGALREFAEIHKITPVPCCPAHIVGNMNLRGDILTLVDMRPVLKLLSVGANAAAKAMVVQLDQLRLGVLVDEVFDVMYLSASDITAVPAAVQLEIKEYLKGTAPYAGKMLSILDLTKILASKDLVVDEEIY
jgi:purine-binding chemotaxis protein CheW